MTRRHAIAIVKGEVLRAEEAVVLRVHGLLRLILRVGLCIGQALLILHELLLQRRWERRLVQPPIDPIARQALKHFLRFVIAPAPGIALGLEAIDSPGRRLIELQKPIDLALELKLALGLFRFAPRLDNRRKESQQ